jgi:hypothetical protein
MENIFTTFFVHFFLYKFYLHEYIFKFFINALIDVKDLKIYFTSEKN